MTSCDFTSSLETDKSVQRDDYNLKQMTLEISPPRVPLDVLDTSNFSEDIRNQAAIKQKHYSQDLNT